MWATKIVKPTFCEYLDSEIHAISQFLFSQNIRRQLDMLDKNRSFHGIDINISIIILFFSRDVESTKYSVKSI